MPSEAQQRCLEAARESGLGPRRAAGDCAFAAGRGRGLLQGRGAGGEGQEPEKRKEGDAQESQARQPAADTLLWTCHCGLWTYRVASERDRQNQAGRADATGQHRPQEHEGVSEGHVVCPTPGLALQGSAVKSRTTEETRGFKRLRWGPFVPIRRHTAKRGLKTPWALLISQGLGASSPAKRQRKHSSGK